MEKILDYLIKLSKKAKKNNEVPVSCIIIDKNNKIVATGINNRQKKYNVLGHAEINAILKLEKKIKDWRLDGYVMYVTLKPCMMCQTIIEECRLDQVFYLKDNENTKNLLTRMQKINNKNYYDQYSEIFDSFFKDKR